MVRVVVAATAATQVRLAMVVQVAPVMRAAPMVGAAATAAIQAWLAAVAWAAMPVPEVTAGRPARPGPMVSRWWDLQVTAEMAEQVSRPRQLASVAGRAVAAVTAGRSVAAETVVPAARRRSVVMVVSAAPVAQAVR